jgi:acyl carrier protein
MPTRETYLPLVIAAVQAVLHDATVPIQATTSLHDLKGFDSLAIVGLIERLEDQLGIELDPALILPETFENPATLAEALLQSQPQPNELHTTL